MNKEPTEQPSMGLEVIQAKRKPDFERALGEIYTRLDNARKLGVDIRPNKGNPTKFRGETYADESRHERLTAEAEQLVNFTRRISKIKTAPVGNIGYLDPETKGLRVLASLPNDTQSQEFIGGDIKIDFTEDNTQVTTFFLELNERLYYDVRLRFAEKGEQRGLTYRSNGSLDEIREEDFSIVSYAVAKAHTGVTESSMS